MAWIKLVANLLHWNERIFFYPKIKKFYSAHIKNIDINIIDVGANKGQSIDFFKSTFPDATIYSFEPNKKLFTRLEVKYQSNLKIKLYPLGISSKKGELLFNENILDETSTLEEINFDSKLLSKKAQILRVSKNEMIVDRYMIHTITLGEFLKEYSEVAFEILKIDVEGHELACLKGLFNIPFLKIPIRFIQLEYHHDDMYRTNSNLQEIEILLNQNGFNKVKEIKHGFGDFYDVIYENT
jgi:FkbM family methyltransferase